MKRRVIFNKDTFNRDNVLCLSLGLAGLSLTVFAILILLLQPTFSAYAKTVSPEPTLYQCLKELTNSILNSMSLGFIGSKTTFQATSWQKLLLLLLIPILILVWILCTCHDRWKGLAILGGRVKLPHLVFFIILYAAGVIGLLTRKVSDPAWTTVLRITLFPAIVGSGGLIADLVSKEHEYWAEKRLSDLAQTIHKLKGHVVIFGHGDLGRLVCRDIFFHFLMDTKKFRVRFRRYDREDSLWERVCFSFVVVEKDKNAIPFLVGQVPGLGEIGYVDIAVFRQRKQVDGDEFEYIQSPLASRFEEEKCKEKARYLVPALVADEGVLDTWEKLKVNKARLVISTTHARQAENDILEWIVETTKQTRKGREQRPSIIVGCETRRWREFLEERWAGEFPRFEAFHVFEFPADLMSAVARLKQKKVIEPKILIIGQYHKMSLIYYFINALIEGRKDCAAKKEQNILLLSETISLHREAEEDGWEPCKTRFADWPARRGWCQFSFRVLADGSQEDYEGKLVDICALKEPVTVYLPKVLSDWDPDLIVITDREPGEVIHHLTQLKEYMRQQRKEASKMPGLLIVTPTAELRREVTKLTVRQFGQIHGFVTPYAAVAREMTTMARYLVDG